MLRGIQLTVNDLVIIAFYRCAAHVAMVMRAKRVEQGVVAVIKVSGLKPTIRLCKFKPICVRILAGYACSAFYAG